MKKITLCVAIFMCGLSQLPAQTASKSGAAIANQKKSTKSEVGEDVLQKMISTGFPKFVSTGYPMADNARYQKQKEKWIMENPVLYKSMQKSKTITAKK
jgi:hypothetical protein